MPAKAVSFNRILIRVSSMGLPEPKRLLSAPSSDDHVYYVINGVFVQLNKQTSTLKIKIMSINNVYLLLQALPEVCSYRGDKPIICGHVITTPSCSMNDN
jgi:hypothetical protein